jgi:hypothetical protein
MANKAGSRAQKRTADFADTFNVSAIPKPEVTDPKSIKWIQERLDEIRSARTVATDGAKGEEIELTADQKERLVPVLDIGLSIAARGNLNHLEAIAERGRFLCEVEGYLKANRLRIFRAVCSWCGWKKSSAYNWIKLRKTYGDHLTDYIGMSERQLLICSGLKDPMQFLDINKDVAGADEAELKKLVAQASGTRPKPGQRGTSKLVIGPFCYTKHKDKATISGLSPDHHQAIQELLETMSGKSETDGDEVSSALDASGEIKTVENSEIGSDLPPQNKAPMENTANPAGMLLISQFPESLSNAHAQA